jgi:hypothetical protein
MRTRTKTLAAVVLAVIALGSVSALLATAQNRSYWNDRNNRNDRGYYGENMVLPSGTAIDVELNSRISTENANRGDRWTGTINRPVVVDGQVILPEGSRVDGVVTSSAQGTHETRPQIGLAVRRVRVDGRSRRLSADTEPIVAGSGRARKIGAIAGGAAVGALLGHTVAKDKHGTLIGGVLGGLAGYGATRHAFRTLILKEGTVVSFTTSEDLMVWR